MKNLKRALSLVLSAAMMVGMMVVGTGAAYADVKAEHNEEAIAVVAAAGIMGAGDSFNPDGELTRGEMAVIMVNMLDLDTKDFKGAANFTDAGWAAEYIDACYANGIMAGVSATEFGTNMKVTTAQAALMMLKALGYFEEAALNDWMLDTIKQAAKIDLLDGIDAKATAVLTRNEVAQLALNALEATVVEEEANGSNTSIKGEGFEITVDSSVVREELTTTKYDYNKSGEKTLQLIEKLYGNDFEKDTTGETKLGLPATVWYDNEEDEEIVFVADEADDVVIAAKDTDTEALYLDKVDEDFDTKDGITKKAVVSGDVVYYYEQDDDSIKAYIVSYELGQITDVKDDIRTADKKDGVKAYVYIDDDRFNDTDIEGFDAETYVEDAYILFVEKNGEIVASEIAEIVEGKITGTRDGKFKIDGEYYGDLTKDSRLQKNNEVKVVLNKADQIVLVDDVDAATSSDYIYVYSCDVDTDGYTNDDGIKVDETVVTVWGVLADGSKVKYVVKDGEATVANGVYAYSIDDGEIEFEKETDVVKKITGASLDKNDTAEGTVYANSATEFVFVSEDDNKIVVTTATGVKNVNIDNATIYAIYDKDDEDMLTVFVLAEEAELEIDAEYAILLDDVVAEDVNADDDKKTDYTYTVAIDGEETTLTFKDEALKGLAIGAIFTYEMEGNFAVDAKVVAAAPLTAGKNVDRVGEDFYLIAGTEYTLADDAEEYTVTFVFDEDAAADETNVDWVDEIEIETSATLKKDAKVVFVANADDEIEAYFVIKTVR